MPSVLEKLRSQTPAMLDALEALVSLESPSADRSATAACADAVAGLGTELLGAAPQRSVVEGHTHLHWRFGRGRVLLLGHVDTVWPIGTVARWPFTVADGLASGPGTFDMKAGIVQGLHGLATLDDLDGVEVLLTSDEEVGSFTSRRLVEEAARRVRAVLVLEPGMRDGSVKTARKGASWYTINVDGRAAHAGLEPERGVNALVELAHVVLYCAQLARPAASTSVTPTVASAGSTSNTVPASGSVEVDGRVLSTAEQDRVDAAVRGLRPRNPEARIRVSGGPNRPPLAPSASRWLYERARAVAADAGLPVPGAATVGGASDGNITAGVGTPTLDGLGAVGDGAHAEGEHAVVAAMAERAALVAALVDDLLHNDTGR